MKNKINLEHFLYKKDLCDCCKEPVIKCFYSIKQINDDGVLAKYTCCNCEKTTEYKTLYSSSGDSSGYGDCDGHGFCD